MAVCTAERREVLSRAGIKGGQVPKRPWMDDEREFVRLHYRGTMASARNIASVLGRTPFGVKGQVQRLGITRVVRRAWSEEEDERLHELMERYSPTTVAKRMGRSLNSVVVRAKRIGISRRSRFGWYTKRECCEILAVDHHWLQKRIDSGELRATSHYGGPVCKDGLSAWHITEKDFRRFIIENCHEFVGRNVDLVATVDILVNSNVSNHD